MFVYQYSKKSLALNAVLILKWVIHQNVLILVIKFIDLKIFHKIVYGMDKESLEEIKKVYDLVIEVGTYPVSTIKTAEAVKVVENSQRDINIAFMNELAMVFDRMGIGYK